MPNNCSAACGLAAHSGPNCTETVTSPPGVRTLTGTENPNACGTAGGGGGYPG